MLTVTPRVAPSIGGRLGKQIHHASPHKCDKGRRGGGGEKGGGDGGGMNSTVLVTRVMQRLKLDQCLSKSPSVDDSAYLLQFIQTCAMFKWLLTHLRLYLFVCFVCLFVCLLLEHYLICIH